MVGVEKGLSVTVSGDPIRADEALHHGLIDEIVEGDLIAAGVAFAEKVASERRSWRIPPIAPFLRSGVRR